MRARQLIDDAAGEFVLVCFDGEDSHRIGSKVYHSRSEADAAKDRANKRMRDPTDPEFDPGVKVWTLDQWKTRQADRTDRE